MYSYQFGIPAFLYFANFSIFELKMLYTIWKNQNSRYMYDAAMIRKKLVQFYFTFYIIMFFSLFYVMRFYFDKTYIFYALLLTWMPQIIYNAIYKNRMSMPLINIFLNSLNKVLLPFYFRGCPDNFFQISHDYSFIAICFICMVAEVTFMYSQTILGPRWFLPKYFNIPEFNFYRSKAEVLNLKTDADHLECVICLFNLFGNESYKYFSDDFIAAVEDDNRRIKSKMQIMCSGILHNVFEFHEYSININKKPYMMTPCRHFFHSGCLESWFKQKKECPSCRQEIDNSLYH